MDFTQVLKAYRTLDPVAWISVYRMIPTWLGIVLVVLGLAMLLFGGGPRAFRAVAGPLGALLGYIAGPLVAQRFGFAAASPQVIATTAAAGLGVSALLFPPIAVFVSFGIAGGFAGGALAGPNDWFLGFFPGFIAVGAVAVAFTRTIGAILSSLLGAWLLVLGVLSALHQVGGVVAAVANQPYGVLLAAGLFAIAGAIFQIFVRPSPEEAERLRIEKARAKARLAEQRALEKRWSTYGADKKG